MASAKSSVLLPRLHKSMFLLMVCDFVTRNALTCVCVPLKCVTLSFCEEKCVYTSYL